MADNHNKIQIAIDDAAIEEVAHLLRHVKDGAKTAIRHALNAAVNGIKTDGAREVSKIYAVGKETVKRRMWINKSTTDNLAAEATRKGPRFFARSFPHDRNTNPGVRGGKAVFLRPRRDGGGWFLDADATRGKSGVSKAFVATLPSRGRGVFVRIGNHRDRLTHARGLSVPEMLGDPEIRRKIEAGASERLNKELDRQVKLMLKKSEVSGA